MKLGVLFSGGKDSCLALHRAIQEGHEVKCLMTILPETQESFMFHTPYPELLEKQAEMLGIKLITLKSKAEKEKELIDLEKLLILGKKKFNIEGICIGGIASNYQGDRVKRICDKLGLKLYAPLWGLSSEEVWNNLFDEQFKVILTKVSCEGIPHTILGKIITEKEFLELKKRAERYKFRIDFEGGEAESAVLGMPDFKKEIKINFKIKEEDSYNAILEILEVK